MSSWSKNDSTNLFWTVWGSDRTHQSFSSVFGEQFAPLGHERVYLPLREVADTPFHVQGGAVMDKVWLSSFKWVARCQFQGCIFHPLASVCVWGEGGGEECVCVGGGGRAGTQMGEGQVLEFIWEGRWPIIETTLVQLPLFAGSSGRHLVRAFPTINREIYILTKRKNYKPTLDLCWPNVAADVLNI